MKWTDEEKDRMSDLLAENPDASLESIAPHFPDHGLEAVGRRMRRTLNPVTDKTPALPTSTMLRFTQAPVLKTDDCLVVSDLHAPHQHAPFLRRVLRLASAWKVTHAIINGDLFDHSTFKTHPRRSNDPTFSEELRHVRGVVKAFGEQFNQTLINLGNHEERWLLRVLNSALDVNDWQRLFNDNPNVQVTDFPHVFIHGKRGKTVAGHPSKYSRIPVRVASGILRERYPDHNVITGHTHHVGLNVVSNSCGTFVAIDEGCCAVTDSFEYAEKSFSDIPAMNVGCVIIKGGRFYLLTPESDFDALERMYS